MLHTGNLKERLKCPLAIWWVSLPERLRKMLPPLLVQEKRSLSWLLRYSFHVEDLIQQAILEIVWSTGGKLLPTSEGDSRAVHKAACG